jgi:hypothetical protein
LRGIAGVCSAWVLICASSWCLPELARRHAAPMGGWIYSGVGIGIALTGIVTWLGGNQSARALWIELGLLAALATLGTAWVMRGLRDRRAQRVDGTTAAASAAQPSELASGGRPDGNDAKDGQGLRGTTALVLCYAAFGFGYIVPATFLPTMARQLVSDPMVFGLTWPIFGVASALSVAVATRWLSAWPRRRVWAMAQGAMALGSLLPLLANSLAMLAASAVLVGGTFMIVTMAGLQLARERMPANPTPLLARMTPGFAVGQIAGPLFVRALGDTHAGGWDALGWANVVASVLLAISAAWLWRDAAPARR